MLLAIDDGLALDRPMHSERWGLSGRPDELRRLPDGRRVPIEWKSRSAPRGGPFPSHRAQVLAYLALVEETTGAPPPFGLLRYGDGTEFRIPWDRDARAELGDIRAAIARPYDGRHLASPTKCAGCRWRTLCDVRASAPRGRTLD